MTGRHDIRYAGPGDMIADQPYRRWPNEHKFIVTADVDPAAPALLVNTIGTWLSDRGERCAAWRTPRGQFRQIILVSIKSEATALMFKLTWGGMR